MELRLANGKKTRSQRIPASGELLLAWLQAKAEKGVIYSTLDLCVASGVSTMMANGHLARLPCLDPYTAVARTSEYVRAGYRMWGTPETIAEAKRKGV
jgi:hypothetical protein